MTPALSPDEIVALNRLTVVARLLAGTVHDLNNALMIIGASAESVGSTEDLALARRAGERIQKQANRAAGSLVELTHFARDRGDDMRRVSLREVVANALAMRAYAHRRAQIAVQVDAAAPPAIVQGASTLLRQAVLNLLLNAEQALQGQRGAVIRATVSETADDAVLELADNGPGVDSVVGHAAFEPFVSARRVADATGLGLTAVRIIAERHGGGVRLESSPQGVIVTLRLPLLGTAEASSGARDAGI